MSSSTERERLSPLRFLARVLIKFLMLDALYLRKKLLLQYVVHGPEHRLRIGRNTDPNDTLFNTMSGTITVGDYSFFGYHCQVLTGTHRTDLFLDERRQQHPREGRDILIGDGVWIGSGAIILGKVTIASHCVIAAGSVVRDDCVTAGIYAGNPAQLVKSLDVPAEPPESIRC